MPSDQWWLWFGSWLCNLGIFAAGVLLVCLIISDLHHQKIDKDWEELQAKYKAAAAPYNTLEEKSRAMAADWEDAQKAIDENRLKEFHNGSRPQIREKESQQEDPIR